MVKPEIIKDTSIIFEVNRVKCHVLVDLEWAHTWEVENSKSPKYEELLK